LPPACENTPEPRSGPRQSQNAGSELRARLVIMLP
jgi:hypothetical protein